MANWSLPSLASLYEDLVSHFKARDVDAATMFRDTASNVPTGAVRLNRTTGAWEEWSGSAWVVQPVPVLGGGTGATTASGARTALSVPEASATTAALAAKVAKTGDTMTGDLVVRDLFVNRTGAATTGLIFFGTNNRYLYCDGSNFYINIGGSNLQLVDMTLGDGRYAAIAHQTAVGQGTHGVYSGLIAFTNGALSQAPAGWTGAQSPTGRYTVTHGLGTENYNVVALPVSYHVSVMLYAKASNSFSLDVETFAGSATSSHLQFMLHRYG